MFRAGRSAAQQLGEEQPRLLQRRQLQRVVQLVIVVKRGGRRRVVDLPQVEPVIGERLDEAPRLGIVEHPLGLRPQHVRLAQLAAVGQGPQRVVGDRVPQEQGQPRGQRVVVEPARLLLDEHEARRRQDGRVRRQHGPGEAVALLDLIVEQRQEPLHVGLGDRPAIRLLQERSQQPLGVLPRRRGFDLVGRFADDGAAEAARSAGRPPAPGPDRPPEPGRPPAARPSASPSTAPAATGRTAADSPPRRPGRRRTGLRSRSTEWRSRACRPRSPGD